ncbi:hypothetical protein PGTUg99_001523 [Puccinia graminis f. sp. tritici]|uniref:Secreted protein n=1 Tax=Puccinia graminis f. sp. tritici TaxID=56615 RepID=A0A5B0NXK1_PUCGR|nr:hypothetical protein PGTUg99_001523 [Puccinia graminis f. sp. tritici]
MLFLLTCLVLVAGSPYPVFTCRWSIACCTNRSILAGSVVGTTQDKQPAQQYCCEFSDEVSLHTYID